MAHYMIVQLVLAFVLNYSFAYNVDRNENVQFFNNIFPNKPLQAQQYFNYETSAQKANKESAEEYLKEENNKIYTSNILKEFYDKEFRHFKNDTPSPVPYDGSKEIESNESKMKPSKPKGMFFVYINPDRYNPNKDGQDESPLDSWSVIWYIASFGGLVAFFLVVSCSEWCCKRHIHNNHQVNNNPTPTNYNSVSAVHHVPDTPPPSYDQFAPPSYDSILVKGVEKSEYDVYVVPVHTFGSIIEQRSVDDNPPCYLNASQSNRSRSDAAET